MKIANLGVSYRQLRSVMFFGFAAWLTATSILAENWPGWRGPRGDGTSLEEKVPVRWSGGENIAWKIEVPCLGHASPIVWDDRIFLVGADLEHGDRLVVCFD